MRKIHTYINICHLSAFQLKFQRCFGIRKKQILLSMTFLEILSSSMQKCGKKGLDTLMVASDVLLRDVLLQPSRPTPYMFRLADSEIKVCWFPPVSDEV